MLSEGSGVLRLQCGSSMGGFSSGLQLLRAVARPLQDRMIVCGRFWSVGLLLLCGDEDPLRAGCVVVVRHEYLTCQRHPEFQFGSFDA